MSYRLSVTSIYIPPDNPHKCLILNFRNLGNFSEHQPNQDSFRLLSGHLPLHGDPHLPQLVKKKKFRSAKGSCQKIDLTSMCWRTCCPNQNPTSISPSCSTGHFVRPAFRRKSFKLVRFCLKNLWELSGDLYLLTVCPTIAITKPAFPKAGVTDRLVSDFKLDSGSLRLSGCGTLTDGECRIRFRRLLEVLVWRCWFHIQSRTTKGRKFYFAWMKEIWAKLTSDSDSDGLETSENDSFFRIFPTHFLGPSKFKKNLNICIYILHRNHSPLWHCTVLFLLFYSPSSCFIRETGSISFQKPPRTVALQARYLYIVKKCSES